MKKWLRGVLLLFAIAVGALAWTFMPQRLEVSNEPLGALPEAKPPPDMTISSMATGMMHSKAGFAYRGGSLTESRDFTMTVALVHHPRGDVLIDSGFGRDVDAHFATMPSLMRHFSSYEHGTPVRDYLARAGYDPTHLAGTLLTHAHWDHVSGLPDLAGVPVWMSPEERRFVASGGPMGALFRSFTGLTVREYAWDGGPYLGFPRSHDVWSDGSIVLVPAPGHTQGSIVAFVTLPSGSRFAFVGDLVWQREGIEIPAERPWASRELVDEDPAAVRENIARMARVHAQFPAITIVPAHDARVWAELPAFPATRQ